jgi:hypothetical protein
MCRSTVHPTLSATPEVEGAYRRSCRVPSSRTTYLAPGQTSGPFSTSRCSSWMLSRVTRSGKVRFRAMDLGTPTCHVGAQCVLDGMG